MSSYQFFASLSISLSMISPNNKISHLYGSILRQLLNRPSPVLSTGFEEKRAAAIRSTTTTAEEEDNLNLQFPKDESFVDISQPESIGGSFDCPREDAPENTIPIHDSLQLVIFQFNVSPDLSSGWDFIAPSFLVIVTFLLLLPERFYYVDRRRKLLRSSFHFVLANLLENLLNNNNNSHSIFLLLSFGIVIVISFFSRWINLSQSDAFFFFFDGSPARLANPMNDVFFCCCFVVW